MKIHQHLQSILHANDTPSLLVALSRFGNEFEFDLCAINAVVDGTSGQRFVGLREISVGYDDEFENEPSAAADPVCQHIRHSLSPIPWTQATYTDAGRGNLWETMHGFGVCSGISVAFHLPKNEHLSLGFNSPSRQLGTDQQIADKLAAFQLCSVYALEAARRILFPIAHHLPKDGARAINALNLDHLVRPPEDLFTAEEVERIGLSPREIECLKWHAAGKSLWDTGFILSISEETVKKRLMSVRSKMNFSTNVQAAVAAAKLGLIEAELPKGHLRPKAVESPSAVRR